MKVYTHNNKVLTNSVNGKWLKEATDQLNPLNLPDVNVNYQSNGNQSVGTGA